MYKFRVELFNKVNINRTKLADEVGITRQYAGSILLGRINCSKLVAYAITKYLDERLEICEFFERV